MDLGLILWTTFKDQDLEFMDLGYYVLLQTGRIYNLWTYDLLWTTIDGQDLEFMDLGLTMDQYIRVGFRIYGHVTYYELLQTGRIQNLWTCDLL